MDTPQKRLEAATPCGVIRGGHPMTMVRLDDVASLVAAEHIGNIEARHMREKIEKLELERDEARRFADEYRRVWELVSAAVEETPNADPLPWQNVAGEPRSPNTPKP